MPRLHACQLAELAAAARTENSACGFLYRRNVDCGRWQLKWFALYRNLLFHYDSDVACKASGVTLLEGCYTEQITTQHPAKKGEQKYGFAVYFKCTESVKLFDLLTDMESDYTAWVQAIQNASFSKVSAEREQLQQKHAHVLHMLESERRARWSYMQQMEALVKDVKKLKAELRKYKIEHQESSTATNEEEDKNIKKLCKVQSFFRGWLCRRRWKHIVDEYIRSPQAENMRLRNAVVFGMVAEEEEYTKNMSTLVSCFLRPLKMAASSKKPVISHDDVNSIFLNSETILFLHQIFLKGLAARMDNWPTLVIGDLFDMLLPMLGIYQEYVRNHHYSLQVLAEYKQKDEFGMVLRRLEEKICCNGRVLETFLTYPMHQIPKYILNLHQLLAYTPHDHIERRQLEAAMSKLEDLSRAMQDEVSETENIRKNLAIERMIVEGCDILLDVNQTFVRQGALVQIISEKGTRGRLSSFGSIIKEKEVVRRVFLFTNHLLLTTRAASSGDRLHLAKNYGKISLASCSLIEDGVWDAHSGDEETIFTAGGALEETMPASAGTVPQDTCPTSAAVQREQPRKGLEFRIVMDGERGAPPIIITLVASSLQEKAAWCSDISQCIESLNYNDLLQNSMSSNSSVSLNQSVRLDPRLYKSDSDVKYCKSLNSCKVPQIRHAGINRLLERLTDLRFLSIDFLNTFLTSYRVFTTSDAVVESLSATVREACEKRANNAEKCREVKDVSFAAIGTRVTEGTNGESCSTASQPPLVDEADSEVFGEDALPQPGQSAPSEESSNSRNTSVSSNGDGTLEEQCVNGRRHNSESRPSPRSISSPNSMPENELRLQMKDLQDESNKGHYSNSLVASVTGSGSSSSNMGPLLSPRCLSFPQLRQVSNTGDAAAQKELEENTESCHHSAVHYTQKASRLVQRSGSLEESCTEPILPSPSVTRYSLVDVAERWMPRSAESCTLISPVASCISSPKRTHIPSVATSSIGGRNGDECLSLQVLSRTREPPTKLGSIVTSSRQSLNRFSSSAATAAFAAATAGACPKTVSANGSSKLSSAPWLLNSFKKSQEKKECLNSAAVMRVLNILKHWISKYTQDLQSDERASKLVRGLLEDMAACAQLTNDEQKVAGSLLTLMTVGLKEPGQQMDLQSLLSQRRVPSNLTSDTILALDLAEQLTLLDQQIFLHVNSTELLCQAWMRNDKAVRAPHVMLVTKRFNDVSRLVIYDIVSRQDVSERVLTLEKWTAVAEACCNLNNYNGVLQICASFVNSSVYRLHKTWEKLGKPVKHTISRLQQLVSSEGRFKNMRDALHKCDSPAIPYLGMYLSDLTFIEEGSPDFVENNLVNFSKMRMISHVIGEIQQFQQQTYRIQHKPDITDYLLDPTHLLTDDESYAVSLAIEPKVAKSPDEKCL